MNFRNERFHSRDADTTVDVRTPSQKDVDRILDSEAFRRLNNVTQVADSGEGRVFHNRMTHTLKVAQVARRLAEKLKLEQPDVAEALELDPDVVQAAALAHDLGHPPFGHIAEKELDALVRQHGLVDGYEGNPQSFRILTKLEPSGRGYPGLNLTRATLNAILKYPKLRQMKGKGNRKWGAYWTEREIFEWVREGAGNERRSVEAELMDWADDITFSLHDVEDFYKAGLISPTMFRADVTENEASAYMNEVLSRLDRDKHNTDIDTVRDEAINFLRFLPFAEPFKNTRTAFGNLRLMRSVLLDRYVSGGIRLNPRAVEDRSLKTVVINPEFTREIQFLKALTWRYVIHSRDLATQQYGKQRIIRQLFEIFLDVLNSEDEEVKFILPEDYEVQLASIEDDMHDEENAERPKRARVRLVADIISSMDDSETVLMHKRLTGIDPGSIFQRLPR